MVTKDKYKKCRNTEGDYYASTQNKKRSMGKRAK
jgi:hypothetical protein